jgi:hypothetical protein
MQPYFERHDIVYHNVTMGQNVHIMGGDIRPDIVDPREVARYRMTESASAFPPVVSLYAPGKHSPMCPEFINEMRITIDTQFTSADLIVVIGTRYMPDDNHIFAPIVDASAPVIYVGGNDDATGQLHEAIGSRLDHIGEKFADSIPALEAKLGAFAVGNT